MGYPEWTVKRLVKNVVRKKVGERFSVPVAPRGCPLEMSPPLGFTTNFPPYVLSPLSISSPALPAEEVRQVR